MNYYELLEVSSSASTEVIKAAYKVQVVKYHPDNIKTGNEEMMKKLNEAYDTLSDYTKRSAYDAILNEKNSSKYQQSGAYASAEGNEYTTSDNNNYNQEANYTYEEEPLEEINLKWYLSLFFIIFISQIFGPAAFVLFCYRCVKLVLTKNIIKRRRKIIYSIIWGAFMVLG